MESETQGGEARDRPGAPAPEPGLPWAAILVAITAVTYLPALGAGFVWDDARLILDNSRWGEAGAPLSLFLGGLWDGVPGEAVNPSYYRPILLLSLWFDRQLGGAAWVGHAQSWLWHLLNVGLLVRALRARGLGTAGVVAGGLFFALHPVQVEAVAFQSARNDLLVTSGLLVGILLEGRALALFAFLFAALSKESALLAPLLVICWRGELRGGARAWMLAGGAVLLALAARAAAGVPFDHVPWNPEALLSLPSLSRDILWPVGLAPGEGIAWSQSASPAWALGLLVLTLAAGVVGGPVSRWGALFAGLAFAPTLAGISWNGLLADRYLYLPMLGAALAFGAAADRLPGRSARSLSPLAFLGAVGVFAALRPWSDNAALWSAMVKAHPSPYTWSGYAQTREVEGDLDGAAAAWHEAVGAPRPMPIACFRVAAIQLERGEPAAAAAEGRRALDNGCARSPELLAPTALGLAVGGEWSAAVALVADVDRDPTGLAVLVRVSEAALRGDLDPLRAAAREPSAGGAPLADQVAFLLDQAGEPAASARVRAADLPPAR